MYYELIFGLLSTLMLGFISALLGWALDFAMDYGHLFYKIRLNKAKVSAKRQGLEEWFNEESEKAISLDFGERISAFDKIYWDLTKNDFGFSVWICVICLTSRISFFIGLAGLFVLSVIGTIEWWGIPLGIVPVLLFSFLSIKLLIKI